MSAKCQKRTHALQYDRQKRKDRLAAVSPNNCITHLRRSTGTLRKARTRTKGEARVELRRARSDLQYFIGNVEGKYLFLRLQYEVRHDIDPFVGAPSY